MFQLIGLYSKMHASKDYSKMVNKLSIFDFIFKNFMVNNNAEFENKVKYFTDKHNYGLNSCKELSSFFAQHYECLPLFGLKKYLVYQKELGVCSSLDIYTSSGICKTFLYNNDNIHHAQKIEIANSILINSFGENLNLFPHYMMNKIILHPKLTPPSDESIDINQRYTFEYRVYDTGVELKKTIIERLKKPYFTKCQDYYNSNKQDCLNNCFLKKYLDKLKCLPNSNRYTIILNPNDENDKFKFCSTDKLMNITNLENRINYHCHLLCDAPCLETLYHISMESEELSEKFWKFHIYFKEKIFKYIKYIPEITSMEFSVKLLNLWNFWQGTYLIQISTIFMTLATKLVEKFKIEFNKKNSKLIFTYILTMFTFLFVENLIESTIKYLRFDTITKINLKDYSDDHNYPYVSILFEHDMPHFMVDYLKSKSNLFNESEFYKDQAYYYHFFYDYQSNLTGKRHFMSYNSIQRAEFWLSLFNISKNNLFSIERFKKYYLDNTYSSLANHSLLDNQLSLSFNIEAKV